MTAATLMRELGHDFVAHDLDDEQLDEIRAHLEELQRIVADGQLRTRVVPSGALRSFKMAVPSENSMEKHQLFSDSIVSGGSNPMGLGGYLWREGDVSVMQVTLGKAFEGAPGRAHGGIVAALLDETMGLVMAINDVLAYTVQLDISYLAPTPVNEPIVARAWLKERDGRKLLIAATVQAGETELATATGLFIAVDPQKFLEHLEVVD
ncbi:MAG: PaaI family thioesterase [Acidimicrobiales bacterium]|jgi:acyl-coenzyme A thioesterase PaaI-like protein